MGFLPCTKSKMKCHDIAMICKWKSSVHDLFIDEHLQNHPQIQKFMYSISSCLPGYLVLLNTQVEAASFKDVIIIILLLQ